MFNKKYKKALELLEMEIDKTHEEFLLIVNDNSKRADRLSERFIALSELRKRFWKEIGP